VRIETTPELSISVRAIRTIRIRPRLRTPALHGPSTWQSSKGNRNVPEASSPVRHSAWTTFRSASRPTTVLPLPLHTCPRWA